jgi:hypothetical protein
MVVPFTGDSIAQAAHPCRGADSCAVQAAHADPAHFELLLETLQAAVRSWAAYLAARKQAYWVDQANRLGLEGGSLVAFRLVVQESPAVGNREELRGRQAVVGSFLVRLVGVVACLHNSLAYLEGARFGMEC